MGAVEAIEWAYVLCGHHIQNDWGSRAMKTQFCAKLSLSPAETIWTIQNASRDNAMSGAQIKVWHKLFKDHWESVESDARSGRPATSRPPENVERVWAAINKDQWLTVQELAADMGIPKTIVSKILMQDLGIKHIMAKFIPRLMLPKQKEYYATVANDLIQTDTTEPGFLKKVRTGN